MTGKILLALNSILEKMPKDAGNGYWTKSIKQALGDLGKSKGFEIGAAGMDDTYEKEWLYDLIWYKEEEGFLKSVPLVVESEWDRSYKGIQYDFEKLLVARAEYKIMIFQATGDIKTEYFKKMKHGIDLFQADAITETYMLCCYDEDIDDFDVQII